MDPLQLKVYIWMYLSTLIREENVTLSDASWKFSDNVLGTLDLSDIIISGFETLTNDINNMSATEDEDNNNDLCVILPIERLQFALNYVADIGIDDEIPIYGEGKFTLKITDAEFNLCMFINHNEVYISEVVAQSVYHHGPVEFTGFWRNREVSLILEGLLSIVNRFFAMWNSYEPERASCIFSPFVSYVLNNWFENENNSFEFDKTCLQRMFFDGIEHNGVDNLEEHVLKKIMKSPEGDDADNSLHVLIEDNKYIILPILKHLTQTLFK